MADEAKETEIDFGGEEGATTGYRRFGEDYESEEEPTGSEGEPEEETTDEDSEEEPKDEDSEGEPGEEEGEEEIEVDFKLPEVSKELEGERKQMQKLVSDRLKSVGGLRIKAQLVDAIDQNPEQMIPYLAERYGIDLGQPTSSDEGGGEIKYETVNIEPKENENLHEYLNRVNEANFNQIFKAIGKLVQQPKAAPKRAPKRAAQGGAVGGETALQTAIDHLDKTYPDWGIYEDRMVELVMKHRSLLNDPDELYKLAKGSSANISDASKAKRVAKKKGKGKTSERPGKVVKIRSAKGKIMSVAEAWDRAKQDLRG